jgi:hypothetical protein
MPAKGYWKESSVMDFHPSKLGGSLVKKIEPKPYHGEFLLSWNGDWGLGFP